jgi:hypothetical protein
LFTKVDVGFWQSRHELVRRKCPLSGAVALRNSAPSKAGPLGRRSAEQCAGLRKEMAWIKANRESNLHDRLLEKNIKLQCMGR